ncbi:MAG: ATP-binding protein [Armatimonadetes bacterium]|nr:ATP-binding protein [Armatimonadota bacterium]
MSAADAGVIEMKVPCDPRFLSVVRLAVAGAAARAGLAVAEIDDVKVAISEACTNVIDHAFVGPAASASATFTVRINVGEGELRLEVLDEGAGFDPKHLPAATVENAAERERGLGVFLMQGLMDEVKIESAPGSGTRVLLVKRQAR